VSNGGGCNCAGAVAQLQARVSQVESEIRRIQHEMAQIAQAIQRMSSELSNGLGRVEEAVLVSNAELAAIAGTTAATATTLVAFKSSVDTGIDEAQRLQARQTDAIVQLDSVRTITEARALSKKVFAFSDEVDQRFAKAVEGVVLNRVLYDKHFGAIQDEYQSKLRTIGSHIYEMWEKDIRPTEQAAQIPASAHQQLALEVDLERLAARSSLLDSDLDMIRDRHLQPLIALDAQFEQQVQRDFAIDGSPPAGLDIVVPAVVVLTDEGIGVHIDAALTPEGELATRGRMPEHCSYVASDAGMARIRRSCRVRPMTDVELSELVAAIDRLVERGVVDPALVPGYRKYLEAVRLGIIDSAVPLKEAASA
jgi:hypothetical protein